MDDHAKAHLSLRLPSDFRGERFDRAVHQALVASDYDVSVREVRRSLREGIIRVDGRQRAPGQRCEGGEEVCVEQFIPRSRVIVEAEFELCAQAPVLMEWPDVVALHKPSGWACAPLRPEERGTLLGVAVAIDPEIRSAGPPLEGGLAHRLDIGTSGVVLFGRSREARLRLRTWFSKHAVQKTYLALVEPPQSPLPAVIDGPIRGSGDRVSVGPSADALPARSEVRVQAKAADVWRVEVRTSFGRRHQVRAHLASVGAPIVGDTMYGGRSALRLMLHAESVELPDGRSVSAPSGAGFHLAD